LAETVDVRGFLDWERWDRRRLRLHRRRTEGSLVGSPSDHASLSLELVSRLQLASVLCAGVAVLCGSLALFGWSARIGLLERLVPGGPPMKANAAMCFVIAGMSLIVRQRSAPGSLARSVAALGAALVAGVGVATLVEYVFGVRLGIDQLLVGDRAVAHAPHPGRPAVNAALGIVFIGGGLLVWEIQLGHWRPSTTLACGAGVLGLLASLGYTTGAASLIDLASGQQIAVNSAIALVLLSLGMLLAFPEGGAVAMLASTGQGGVVLRRLLPAAVGVPVTLAGLTLAGHRLGLFGANVEGWVFASAVTFTFAAAAWLVATAAEGAERERGRMERLMRAIAETASDAMVVVDRTGAISYANPALGAMFGCRLEEIAGRESETLVCERDREYLRLRIAALAGGDDQGSGSSVAHLTGVRGSGQEFEIELSSAIYSDGAGPVIAAVIRDVSARHRDEQKLRGLLESAPDAIVIVDSAGEIVLANARAESLFGYARSELLGRPVQMLMSDRQRHSYPEMLTAFLADPRPRQVAIDSDPHGRRKDGSEFPVEIMLNPIDTDDGLLISSAVRDVTERRRAQRATARLAAIVESSPHAVIGLAPDGTIESWNSGAEQLYGHTGSEAIGNAVTILNSPEESGSLEHVDAAVSGQVVRFESEDVRKDGSLIEVEVTIAPVRGPSGAITGVSCQAQDITERKQFERLLRTYAEHDPLTNLFNRRRLDDELERRLAENERYGTPATLLICDLDNLKLINDTLGHNAGDQLIQGVARELAAQVRDTDLLARLGGDEFAMLLPHTDLKHGLALAERLRSAARDLEIPAGDRIVHTTLSIGAAQLERGLSTDEWMAMADIAMYEAKGEGRNRVMAARTSAGDNATRAQLGWLDRLRSALSENRFELHAQPIADVHTGEIRSRELLLRMRESDGQLITPSAFIYTAERFGLIAEIDRWVIHSAISILAADRRGNASYSVNLSGVSVGDAELLRLIEREITDAGVDPSRLTFEFTETAAMRDLAASRQFTEGLARIGCRSALDDFGSGFASFSYLKHLPVDYAKIDGEFVRSLPGGEDDRLLAKAIIDTAHALHKQTIAEHVASDDALDLLRDFGVHYVQGFHIGKPQALQHTNSWPQGHVGASISPEDRAG
jgi:diguanylate cyclase (GGDEF)-like protein/PAS domain S-box-containing protein